MAKIKTAIIIGEALNWAVSTISNIDWDAEAHVVYVTSIEGDRYSPSTDQQQGGDIIDREYIETVTTNRGNEELWEGIFPGRGEDSGIGRGPTRLIAAMRAYVAFKLGDEVEVPEGLAQ